MINVKWLGVAAIALPLVATGAWAAPNPDTGPGCGLGKVIWSESGNQKAIAPQVLQSTTNGTFGTQTFGISTGTSGCTNDGTIMGEHKVNAFASINYHNLSQEMAQGGGEHLASLGQLMGVPEEQLPEFFALAQSRYPTLAASSDNSPAAMVELLRSGMQAQQ